MNRIITFVVLMIFWLIWSGMFDAFHAMLGVLSVAIVTSWTGHLLVQERRSFGARILTWWRLEWYSFWLLWQIVLANFDVFKLAFHPQLLSKINPHYISFQGVLKGDVAQYVFAQSITLTPGTVTRSIENNEWVVHALTDEAASALPGVMQDKVAAVFKDDHAHA